MFKFVVGFAGLAMVVVISSGAADKAPPRGRATPLADAQLALIRGADPVEYCNPMDGCNAESVVCNEITTCENAGQNCGTSTYYNSPELCSGSFGGEPCPPGFGNMCIVCSMTWQCICMPMGDGFVCKDDESGAVTSNCQQVLTSVNCSVQICSNCN